MPDKETQTSFGRLERTLEQAPGSLELWEFALPSTGETLVV